MSYQSEVLADNPIVYWKQDEAASAPNALDSSGNSHDGTYTVVGGGGPGSSPLITVGGCAQYTGDDRIDIAGNAAFNPASVSVEFWMKSSQVSADIAGMFCIDTGGNPNRYLNVWLKSTGVIEFWLFTQTSEAQNTKDGSIVVNDNASRHIVCTYDAGDGNAHIYVNGAEDGSPTNYGIALQNANSGIRCGQFGGGGHPYVGFLDEIALYGAALSPARILVHYNAGLGIFPSAQAQIPGPPPELGLQW